MRGRFPTSLWLVALMMFAGPAWADAIVRIDADPAWRNAESITELA